MFGFFKSKTEVEKLQEKYLKLMQQAHALSTINRKESDDKVAEAEIVSQQISQLLVK